jgi:hypothetical protein
LLRAPPRRNVVERHKTLNLEHATPRKGCGAGINPEGRFENTVREVFDDGWHHESSERPLKTHVTVEYAKSIITPNDSPVIPFLTDDQMVLAATYATGGSGELDTTRFRRPALSGQGQLQLL